MRILYVATAIEAGGTSGGSTHVTEVACGLKSLGHELLVVARPTRTVASRPALPCNVPLRFTPFPQQLALLALLIVIRAVKEFEPDVVMERFYNFAGAGVLAAHRRGMPSLLEVNAPMVDPPGSLKTRLDTLALRSMRRWAVRQAKWSAAIVTPLASTVPLEISRRKIHELPWGANIEQFDPALRLATVESRARLVAQLGLEPGAPVAAFLGSFRAWHGVSQFTEAARRLLMGGSKLAFLTIGGGPELEPLKRQVAAWGLPPGRFVFAGPQPHERVPQLLALADIGVAPFDLAAHAPLTTFGFYWSPLKVFEYMAIGLPVVTIDVTPLNEIVRHEREGLLYRPGDMAGLARALDKLALDSALREKLGAAARKRVVERYSWHSHCLALEQILLSLTGATNA